MLENPIEMILDYEETPEEQAASRLRRAHFDRNADWFTKHAVEIGETCAGKHICVAGEELFVGDDSTEVYQRAQLAHPEDKGIYFQYIYREKGTRIYGSFR